jgi:hypothetical protein
MPRRRLESRAIDSFLDLAEGDLVVHVSHGIARYLGMQMLDQNGQTEEHLLLEFREGTRVYVPATKIDLVQKYVGGAKTEPELSKLGGTGWQHKKDKVQAAVMDLASEMIELQALRAAQPGIGYPPDSEWQAEFEAAFPYQETPDQLTTMTEIKRDMERLRPMDRLICGHVGYGKTEASFYRCTCSGFGRRLHHAVDSPFMARRRDGARVLSAASLAGFLAGHVVSASTWYPAPLGTRDGLRHAGMSLISKIGVDVFKEFRPRRGP